MQILLWIRLGEMKEDVTYTFNITIKKIITRQYMHSEALVIIDVHFTLYMLSFQKLMKNYEHKKKNICKLYSIILQKF